MRNVEGGSGLRSHGEGKSSWISVIGYLEKQISIKGGWQVTCNHVTPSMVAYCPPRVSQENLSVSSFDRSSVSLPLSIL